MEIQKKTILIIFLRKIFFKVVISLMIFCEIFCYPISLNAYKLINIDDNLSECKFITNCIFQTWKVDDSEKAFSDLIQIIENTPRLEIVKKEKNYIHAIATSRIMKFIDDVEIKNLNQDKIIEKEKNYIHAIATSRIMKFIDDLEIKNLNQDNILQIKSSSRLGINDLGVNKRRVQTLRFRLIDIYD